MGILLKANYFDHQVVRTVSTQLPNTPKAMVDSFGRINSTTLTGVQELHSCSLMRKYRCRRTSMERDKRYKMRRSSRVQLVPLVSLTARKAVHESETNKAVSYVGLLSVASSRKDEGKPRAFGNGLASRDVLRLFYFIFSFFLFIGLIVKIIN